MDTSLDLLLIPYNDSDTICVPQHLVEYVLPYARPLPSVSNHRAIIGSLIYQSAKVPVLDIVRLENANNHIVLPEVSDGRYRIIILSCVNQDSYCDNYALISSNIPSLINVTEKNIEETHAPVSPLFHSEVRVTLDGAEQLTYIPNLEKIEATLLSGEPIF